MLKRVKLSHEARRGFYVDLPTYRMIEGSHLPLVAGKIAPDGVLAAAVSTPAGLAAVLALNPTVEVDVPDADCDCDAGRVDVDKIRRRYSAWKTRAAPNV